MKTLKTIINLTLITIGLYLAFFLLNANFNPAEWESFSLLNYIWALLVSIFIYAFIDVDE